MYCSTSDRSVFIHQMHFEDIRVKSYKLENVFNFKAVLAVVVYWLEHTPWHTAKRYYQKKSNVHWNTDQQMHAVIFFSYLPCIATGSLKQTGDSLTCKALLFNRGRDVPFLVCLNYSSFSGIKEHSYRMETIWFFLTVLFAHFFKLLVAKTEYLYLILTFRHRKSITPWPLEERRFICLDLH